MSSRFHDDLIAARRRGEAPGMVTAKPAISNFVDFVDVFEGVPLRSCTRCGAVVTADRAPQHADWHHEAAH